MYFILWVICTLQCFYFFSRQPKYFSQFMHYGIMLKRRIRTAKSNMIFPKALKNIIHYFIAIGITEIDIKIRG